ncbi:DUF7344 domain-containing protein [Halovivax gelatinilyticus]|uniref:DUF7344 domain-containing protein n=1 Tax=Halovivax gelatinilyticus TaxID=2961597 RepID=UPI0020CA98DD|nr:hypothetical protein [Halovivax gelatinilyticus]
MGVNSRTTELPETFGASNSDAEISRDQIFDVLSNHRRICIIRYLKETDEELVSLRDVVEYVAKSENPDLEGQVAYKDRKSVYTALRQTHLPKLDELGIVEFDKSRGVMRLTDRANQVQLYLEYVPRHDIPWHVHYLGVTALSGALMLATYLDIYPFAVGWAAVSVIIFCTFTVSALAHAYHLRGSRLTDTDFVPLDD